MTRSQTAGIGFAFLCLAILGAMPLLSNSRPANSTGLNFAIWLTAWQLVASVPLFLAELGGRKSNGPVRMSRAPFSKIRMSMIALATGAMFGLSTYMYVVAADKAGPVSLAVALQAYPVLAMIWEALFLGKRRSRLEIGLTAIMIAALVYLATGGTFQISEISWWSVFALGIPLLWSIAHILLKQLLDVTPITPNQVTISRLVISGICLLLLQAALGQSLTLFSVLDDFGFQKAAAVMGVAYYLELVFWFHAIRHIDVSVASSVTVPAPAVTMLIAVGMGEHIQTYQIAAMIVIALSLYGQLIAGKQVGLTPSRRKRLPDQP